MIFTTKNKELAIFGQTLSETRGKLIDFFEAFERGGIKGQDGVIETFFSKNKRSPLTPELLKIFENFKKQFNSSSLSAEALAEQMKNVDQRIIDYAKTCKNGEMTTEGFKASIETMSFSAKTALQALAAVGNLFVMWAITKGIELAVHALDSLCTTSKEASETLEKSSNILTTVTNELSALESELETTNKRIEELQKLKDLGTISLYEEDELERLKKENELLVDNIALKKEEQLQTAKETLKNASSKLKNKHYTGDEDSLFKEIIGNFLIAGGYVDAKDGMTELDFFNQSMSWVKDALNSGEDTSNYWKIVVDDFGKIQETISAYEQVIGLGGNLTTEQQVEYDSLKKLQEEYLYYSYILNKNAESYIALIKEQKKSIIVNKLLENGLSFPNAELIYQNMSDKQVDEFYSVDFNFIKPKSGDYENAESYGKAYVEAMFKGAETESNKNPFSTFTQAFNSSDFSSSKEKLLELAKSGEISSSALESTEEYQNLLSQTGLSAEEAKSKILDMLTPSQRLDAASQGISSLSQAYEEFQNNGFVTVSTLESLPDVFKRLDGYDFSLFENIVGDATSSKEAIQQAFEDILSYYLAEQQTMKGVTEENKQLYITQLEHMGISNAEQATDEYLLNLNATQNILTAYEDYVRQKGVLDEAYLLELCNGNTGLLNALNSTYSADYNNWTGLLTQKAVLYNKFADQIQNGQNPVLTAGVSAAMIGMDVLSGKTDELKNNLALNLSTISTDFKGSYQGSSAIEENGITSARDAQEESNLSSETEQTFDWAETAINRLTAALDRLKTKAADTYASWTARSYDLQNAIASTQQSIELHAQAYNRYLAQANSVPLPDAWKHLVQGGAVDISTISDSDLAENIREYQTWYDKAQDCLRTQEELRSSLNELESQKFTNLQSEYESVIGLMEAQKSLIENQITVLSGSADYDRLRSEQTNILTALQNERSVLEATLSSLSIERGTEEWNSLQSAISQVSRSIQDAEASLQEINRMQFDNLKQFYELSIGLMEKQKDIAEGRITLLSSDKDYQSLQQQQQNIITKSEEELKKLNEYKASSAFSGLSHEDQMGVLSDIADKTAALDEAYRTLKKISELQFDNIKEIFEFESGRLEHAGSLIDDKIRLSETRGLYAEKKLYKDQLGLNRSQQNNIREEIIKLTDIRDQSGYAPGTAEWNSMTSEIMSLREQESKLTVEAEGINKTLRETDWEIFDSLAGSVDGLIEESDFLSGLMGNGKLIDKNGQFTDEGEATLSLKLVNADLQKQKAEQYFAEARRLEQEMGRNSGTDLLDRYNELMKAGQDALLDQKSSIKEAISLVEERYQAELDALQKVINKKKEQLQEEKSLYDYQKSIREKTDRIASLEKQKTAYADDNSEETMARIQRIQLELKEAKEDLEETEYEKYLSDSQDMLDTLAQDYEDWMNVRLDNEEAILTELAANVNSGSQSIKETLENIAVSNGAQLSEYMSQIFSGMQTLSDRFGSGTDTGAPSGTEQAVVDKRQEYMDAAGLLPDGLTLDDAQTILQKAMKILPNPEGFTMEDAQKALNIALKIDKGYEADPSRTSKPIQAEVKTYNSSAAAAAPAVAASAQPPAQETSAQPGSSNTPDYLLPPREQGGMLLTDVYEHLFNAYVSMDSYKDASALYTAQEAVKSMITPQSHINIAEINIELPDIQDYTDFRRRLVQDKTFENAMCTMINNAIMGKSTIDKLKYL